MKKIILIVLFLVPLFGIAQDKLIGKTQKEVNAYFKAAKIPLFLNTNEIGNLSDEFKLGENIDITCNYNKNRICVQEMATLDLSTLDKIKANFTRDWVLIGDNAWANKEKSMKVQVIVVQAIKEVMYNYIEYNKEFAHL